MGVRIGLPRAFFYFSYGRLWEDMLKAWGAEPILSGPTDRRKIERGAQLAPEGACLPIRVLLGHVEELCEWAPDYIFLPRMLKSESGRCTCPKTAGLPEIVRYSCPQAPPLLSPSIVGSPEDPRSYDEVRRQLRLSGEKIRGGCCYAWRNYRREQGRLQRAAVRPMIGILGHSYLTEDPEINFHLKSQLEKAGFDCAAAGDIGTEIEKEKTKSIYPKYMFWEQGEKTGNLFAYGLQQKWSGYIFLSAMGCGPDSCTEKYCRRQAEQNHIPYLELVFDEQSGSAGAETRIEAFLDMIERGRLG